jgi:hypothetical protein
LKEGCTLEAPIITPLPILCALRKIKFNLVEENFVIQIESITITNFLSAFTTAEFAPFNHARARMIEHWHGC